ncbi:MAG: hypothetical protein JO001_11015 [Alphaproteobacteria bacterium]|nr:hypothetical protein [Alphaproteobacteria bacterium]
MLPANVVVDLPDDEGNTGQVMVSNASGNTELAKPLAAVGLEQGVPPGQPFITDQVAVKKVFAKVLEATPRQPVWFTINFDPGTMLIAAASNADMARAIDAARSMSYSEITLIEHFDPGMPADPNTALMMARAQGVAGRLVKAGISPTAIDIENYGPIAPVSTLPGAPQLNVPLEIVVR